MKLQIYFLRHGQTAASRDNLFCGASSNPELTPDGHEMASCFAEHYKHLKWEALYASPLLRAQQTVAPIAKALGSQVITREELKEIDFGRWDGRTVDAVNKEFHDQYIRWSADPAWNAPDGGETAIAIARRSRLVIEEIASKYSSGNVLVVSHKATIRIMLCDLLGIDISRFRDRLSAPVGSIAIVEFGNRGPLLKELADRTHMTERLRSLPGT